MTDPRPALSLGDPALGWAFACSRTGASHLRAGKVCQDAYALSSGSVAGTSFLVAAVADGHGDARHDRSHCGSALAVRAAMEELAAMLPHHVAEGAWSQLRTGFEANFPRRLGTRWREAVLADNRDRPPAIHPSGDKGEVLTRYGTTLLATLAVGDLLLLAQLGDGCVLLVRPDGVVERPLASDGHEVGTVTDSLCSPEA